MGFLFFDDALKCTGEGRSKWTRESCESIYEDQSDKYL